MGTASEAGDHQTAAIFERQLTSIEDRNSDLREQVYQLEQRLEASEESVLERVGQVDNRCQRMECILETILMQMNRENQIKQQKERKQNEEMSRSSRTQITESGDEPLNVVDLE